MTFSSSSTNYSSFPSLYHYVIKYFSRSYEIREKKLHRGDVYGRQNKDDIKLILWRDKQDVLMISSRLSDSAILMNTGKTSIQNERIMKLQVVLDYNKGRQDINLSDQLSAYHTCLRRSPKWYRKVAFKLIFETVIVNSYFIYKENYAASDVISPKFRESLVRSLLLGVPSEKVEPSLRQKSTGQTKRKLADHTVEELERSTRDHRRRCARCYEKNRQEQSKEASNPTTKKIKTLCSDCNNFFCLDCFNFNEKHYATQ